MGVAGSCCGIGGVGNTTASILVLFILLVIILSIGFCV